MMFHTSNEDSSVLIFRQFWRLGSAVRAAARDGRIPATRAVSGKVLALVPATLLNG